MYLKENVFVSSECWDRYRIHPGSCDSVVTEAGEAPAARLFFLNWLEGYLSKERVEDLQIWANLRNALGPYRNSIQASKAKKDLLGDCGDGDIRQMKWWLRIGEGSLANLEFPPTDRDMVRIAIEKAGTGVSHDIQLNEPRIKVKQNDRYVVNFLARADKHRSIFLGFAKDHPPWSNLGLYREIELTTEWQTFEEQFVAAADADNARLHFDVGETDISVELASVSLRSLPDGRSIEPRLPSVLSGSFQNDKGLSGTARTLKHLISVIIPCYKQARYLREAIESVLAQTYPYFEIIVVDDGSPDDTPDIAKGYSGIRYVRQNNQGVSAARNTGISESKGDYLIFLDADDRLLPTALQTGLSCLDDHPEFAFASGHIRLISSDGSPLPSPEQSCIERDHYLTLLQGNYIWTPAAVIFRRSVFEFGFVYDTSFSGSADWDLYLRISRSLAVSCHGNVVAEYRVHGAGMTSDSGLMLKECLAVLRAQWDYVKGKKACEAPYRLGVKGVQEFYGRPLVGQIQSHIRSCEWKEVVRAVSVLLRCYPQALPKYLYRGLSSSIIATKRGTRL